MSTIEQNTIAELVEIHDAIEGVEPIGKWKGRKDLLVEKVAAAMKAARGNKTIREVAEALLVEVAKEEDGKPIGHPYDYVLDRVLEEFPEAPFPGVTHTHTSLSLSLSLSLYTYTHIHTSI